MSSWFREETRRTLKETLSGLRYIAITFIAATEVRLQCSPVSSRLDITPAPWYQLIVAAFNSNILSLFALAWPQTPAPSKNAEASLARTRLTLIFFTVNDYGLLANWRTWWEQIVDRVKVLWKSERVFYVLYLIEIYLWRLGASSYCWHCLKIDEVSANVNSVRKDFEGCRRT